MSIIEKLHKNKLITLSHDFVKETEYEVMMGSTAYNTQLDLSDIDIHGITIPPKEFVFPHLAGHIRGFGKPPPDFEIFQQHHIKTNSKEYDVVIHSIVKTFSLAMDNNPNVLDMLWVPENCILHITEIGKYIRKIRKNFLSKASFHRFRGYSFSQMRKLENSPREDLVKAHGYDTKHGSHVIRLLLQCKQILDREDMDITENSELLKSIRRGEISLNEFKEMYVREEKHLDELYHKSNLQHSANEDEIRQYLINCLEMKYGSLSEIQNSSIVKDGDAFDKLLKIKEIINS